MEPANLKDEQLLERLVTLVRQEREDTAAVVEHLAEVNRRGLAEKLGYPSLFEYCVNVLGYPPPSAYHRVRAAKAVQKKPHLLELLRKGELHLRSVVMLHPHLENEIADELVQQARGKSQREVEAILAPLSPKLRPRDTVRVIAVETSSAGAMPLFETASTPPQTAELEKLVQVSFSARESLLELLDQARELLWHKYPDGRLEGIFEEALRDLIEKRDPGTWSQSRRGQSTGRNIPRWIKREVWNRDRGRCTFEASGGRRCGSRKGLEFDHIEPWALCATAHKAHYVAAPVMWPQNQKVRRSQPFLPAETT